MASDDMQIVVTAIIINSQVGGNLSTVLESTISTIRDRMHLFGEIRSLTSYARYVGNFLSLMPFIMGFIIFLMAPDFFATAKTSIITQGILAYGFYWPDYRKHLDQKDRADQGLMKELSL